HQTSPQESAKIPRTHPGNGEGEQANHGWQADCPTQSSDSRVGKLSPPRGEQGHLHQSGYSHLQESVVLGHTEAPKEVWPMGGEAILSHTPWTTMDLRGDVRESTGATPRTRALACRGRGHSTASRG